MNISLMERAEKKVIQKDMFGLFFEDINYGLDGGLFAEMLENRHFEFLKCRGRKCNYYQEPAYQYGWNAYPNEEVSLLSIEESMPLNQVNPHYLCADIKEKGAGFTNKAYEGIYMKEGVSGKITFYARLAEEAQEACDVQIQIKQADQSIICETPNIKIDTHTWKKYETSVRVDGKACEAGIFTVISQKPAKLCFDQFSMIPEDAVYGLFRRDLAELLKELKPGFLRFPGGCVVEGNDLNNRYQWKLTVGPVEERKSNWNRWAVHGNDQSTEDTSPFAHYNQTLGIGFYEYFLLCEYLECAPLPVMNVGLACQYQSKELVETSDPAFGTFVQDALDLIEFANGAVDTKWGSLRAKMGHPESFHLTMIGIGNEQWETEEVNFFTRYDAFEEAIHKQYPAIKCIGSAGPDVTSKHYEDAWQYFSPKMAQKESFAYAVDEHYYVSDQWLYEHVHMYDNYPKQNKVFAGEYACHIHPEEVPERRNSFASALAEAAFMTGLEKNSDVVLMASYAPLLARLGFTQWQPDLIWFDAKQAYETPNYYVQQMYACYTGDEVLDVTGDNTEEQQVYVAASKADDNRIFIKIINAGEKEHMLTIDIFTKETIAKEWSLTGELLDCNSIAEPDKIAPVMKEADLSKAITIAPHSISVFML